MSLHTADSSSTGSRRNCVQNTTAMTLRSKFSSLFYNGTKLELQIITGKYLFHTAKRKNTVVLASYTLFTYYNHCELISHYKSPRWPLKGIITICGQKKNLVEGPHAAHNGQYLHSLCYGTVMDSSRNKTVTLSKGRLDLWYNFCVRIYLIVLNGICWT